MKVTNRVLQFISFRIIGRRRTRQMLLRLFQALDFDMLQVAHTVIGVNNYGNNTETGEDFFIKKYLHKKFTNEPITIFDVGANVGKYSLLLHEVFPFAKVYAFEPNPVAYKTLLEKVTSIKNITPFCVGLGPGLSKMEIYTYKNDKASEHASVIRDVMVDLHHSDDVENYRVDIIDLDSFCNNNSIKKIHFLKIDTEGYELEVLKGAANFIKHNLIEVIQFEFNEMNIFSKSFLKDFYALLPNYSFYRLCKDKLIPLGEYNSSNEIFRYQNIIGLLSSN